MTCEGTCHRAVHRDGEWNGDGFFTVTSDPPEARRGRERYDAQHVSLIFRAWFVPDTGAARDAEHHDRIAPEGGNEVAGKDRRKQLARQRYERQVERRVAQERRAKRARVIGGVTAAAVLVGGGVGFATVMRDDDSGDGGKAAAPGACDYTANPEPGAKNVGTPPAQPAYKGPAQATIKTNLGEIGLELDGAKAPCTVNSLAYLAQKNFFDSTECHRLVTSGIKVLQCGDPTGTGSGGPAYKFGEENLPKPKAGAATATYATGTVAMANAGAGTNGSQFFLVYGDSELPPDYTVFGKITSGMGVIEEVAKAGVAAGGGEGDGKPKKKVTIQDVTVTKA